MAGIATMAPVSAHAQFDPAHNHLQCYRIASRTAVRKTVMLNDQFGNSVAAVLIPVLLCTPTQKTCPGAAGCGQDPEPPVPVRHFKCYKVKVHGRTTAPAVTLIDQFGSETVNVGVAQLLCTPVVKIPVGQTTTTTTTTTTLPFCHLDQTVTPPVCGGSCPDPNATCVNVSGAGCRCVSPPSPCGLDSSGVCSGLCQDPNAVCTLAGPTCRCVPPIPCGQTAPPTCGGQCPAPATCRQGTTGGCACG